MDNANLLITAIIIVLVLAFILTVLVVNANTKKIISTNAQLVDNQNMLLEQNKIQGRELAEQKEKIETLKKRQEELAEQLKNGVFDEVTLLTEQTREHREAIQQTADMTDEQLMAWVDERMNETQLYADSTLTLKTMAQALGLTQRRLNSLFKNNERYANLNEYLNEKRFLLACRLLRDQPNWTIEAVGTEAGFGGRRTFQTEVKRRLGITPVQYRQSVKDTVTKDGQEPSVTDMDDSAKIAKKRGRKPKSNQHSSHNPSKDGNDEDGGDFQE